LDRVNSGSKAFVVCAHIDDDDEDNTSATAMYGHIVNLFGKQNVGLVHGKLKKESQQKIMNDFASGKFSVLVATTIVEVGVDIPEADIMVITTPERFGLATLHQLRGRVGRNGAKSYCFCLLGDISQKSVERLTFFKNHSSGFDIAEYDYTSRGAGDIYGTSQHGTSPNFGINFANYDLACTISADQSLTTADKERVLTLAEENFATLCKDIVMN
jgi:ATP-dependent DNA helicase RecG